MLLGLGWLLTRAGLVALLLGKEHYVIGDVDYYVRSLDDLASRGLAHTLVEYPLPGLAFIAVPWLLARLVAHGHHVWIAVATLSCLTDGAFLWLLDRYAGPTRRAASWLWVLGVPLLGATAYARFDIVPAVFGGIALVLVGRRPALAGVAAAVATAAKFWPALLIPALTARRAVRGPVLAAVAVSGAVLAGVSVAAAGSHRLISPLTYQSARGLQVESIAATPLMLIRIFDHHAYRIFFSSYRAFEIRGPGAGKLALLGTPAMVVLAVVLVGLWALAWRRGAALTPDAVSWLCLAGVTGFMVVSKVLSPQYLLWLLPLAAAALTVRDTARAQSRLRWWSLALLGAVALTQVEFPLGYGGIQRWEPGWSPVVSMVLAARNLVLVGLLIWALREAWWHVRAASPDGALPGPQRGRALARHDRGVVDG